MLDLRHLAIFLCFVASTARAGDDGPRSGTTVPSDPIFTATLTDGSTVAGQIRQLGVKSGVTLVGADGDRVISADQLFKLTREGQTPPSPGEGGIVLFPDGDRLTRSRIGASGEANLDVISGAIGAMSPPIDSILGLIPSPPTHLESLEALVTLVRTEMRATDVLWLGNGDKLSGSFTSMDDKKVAFRSRTGKVELDRSGIVAIGFNPKEVEYRRPQGTYFELALLDGSRIGLTDVKLERGQVVGKARFSSEVRFPIGELAGVHVLGGRVAYLSDRDETKAVYVPYVGPTRPYRRDASVTGRPLVLGGKTYDRGLGTQSRTLLAYKLEPGAKRFQATVGLDDRAGPLGNVAFKVLVDGQSRFESPAMGSGDPTRTVDVDLAGGKLLILITEFADRGDVQDGADWVEARIIR